MRDGLKIYACSGFGVGTTPEKFDYWLDNTSTIHNTCAVNSLLADINYLGTKLMYEQMSESDVLLSLNLIDLYTVALNAAQKYSGENLQHFGNILAYMVANGAFAFASLDNDQRDANLDELIDYSEQLYFSGEYEIIANETSEWFTNNVVNKDYVGLNEQQIENIDGALAFGISGDEKDAGTALHEAGGYYLYLYMGEAQARKMGKVVYKKYLKEREVYKYVHYAYDEIYGSKEAVDKVIYAGITSTYKMTPERVCETLTGKPGVKQIGYVPVAEICSIISAIVTILSTVLSIVLTIVGACLQAKYEEPDDPDFGTPGFGGEDLTEITNHDSLLPKLGIGAAIILLLYGLFH